MLTRNKYLDMATRYGKLQARIGVPQKGSYFVQNNISVKSHLGNPVLIGVLFKIEKCSKYLQVYLFEIF